MSKVTALTDRNGFPPKLTAAGDTLCAEIWEALEKASEAGMPTAMLVGFIEMAKLELLAEVISVYDGEPA
jgi:hypothetical protein